MLTALRPLLLLTGIDAVYLALLLLLPHSAMAACPANCDVCSSSTVCTDCSSGYYLNGGSCFTCSSAMAKCATCYSKVSCLTCQTGYAVNGTTCASCPALILGCLQCSSNTYCTVCDDASNFTQVYPGCGCANGYAMSNSACQLCNVTLSNCLSCSNTSVCTICNNGYVVNNTTCALCSSFIPGCSSCTSKTACTNCNSNLFFSLNGSSCQCISGYILSGGTCQTCNVTLSNCLTCTSASVCTSCKTGYWVNNSACITCGSFMTGCENCSSSTTCTGCVNNSYVLQNNLCRVCSNYMPGCLTCSTNSTCLSCNLTANFELSGSRCICSSGYALNGSICQLCNVSLTACTTCSNISACTACVAGTYVLKSSKCVTCISTITGCTNCLSNTTCSACNSTNNFTLNNTSGLCDCIAANTLYGSTCKVCSSFLLACVACSSPTTCTQCSQGYALTTGYCRTCSELMSGCLNCSDRSTCTQCNEDAFFTLDLLNNTCKCLYGYARIGTVCRACSSFMAGCQQCNSSTVCTECNVLANFQLASNKCGCIAGFALVASSCQNCSTLLSGCLTCSSRSVCTSCDPTGKFQLNGSLCSCQNGYYFNGSACPACSNSCVTCRGTSTNCTSCADGKYLEDNECKPCAPGCLNCTSLLNCSSCDTGYNLENAKCVCGNGTYFNNITQGCDVCHATCYTCTNGTAEGCASCIELQFRLLSGSMCQCNDTNYEQSLDTYPKCKIKDPTWCREVEVWDQERQECVEKCGDGKLYTLECDDGNNYNGDGCSSDCKIEVNYTCINGTNVTKSVCSYSQALLLTMVSIIKEPNSNSLTFTISVQPILAGLSMMTNLRNFVEIIMPYSEASVSYSRGTLTVRTAYKENVQGIAASISINPPDGSSGLFAIKKSTVDFLIEPINNEAAIFFNESVYAVKNKTDGVVQASQGLGLGGVVAGVFFTKTISLELTGVLQMSLFGLATVDKMNPIQSSLKELQSVNGYNQMFANFNSTLLEEFQQSRRLLSQSQQNVNVRLKALGFNSPHLLQNFNYMFILIMGVMLFGFCVYLFYRWSYSPTAKKIYNFVLKEIAFSLLFFSVNLMGMSFGVQCRYLLVGQNWTASLVVSWLFAILSLVIFLTYVIYYIVCSSEFQDFSEKFQPDRCAQCHYPILLIGRYVLGIVCGYFNEFPQICYAVIGYEVVFMIYLCAKRPYSKEYLNVIAIINESTVLLISVINMLYRNFIRVEQMNEWYALAPSWIQIGLAGIATLANYTGMIMYLYYKCCNAHAKIFPKKEKSKLEQHQLKIDTKKHHEHKEHAVELDASQHNLLDGSQDGTRYDMKSPEPFMSKAAKKRMVQQLVDFEEDEFSRPKGGSFEREVQNISLNLGAGRPKKILTKGRSQQI